MSGNTTMTGEDRSPDSFTGLEMRSILAVLWRSELPIAAVMKVSRERGDEMSVRDVFLLTTKDGDPLGAWIELLTEDIP